MAEDAPFREDEPLSAVQRRAFLRGFHDAFGLPSLVLVATFSGIGGLIHDVGYPIWAGVLSTFLIWAGPAQVMMFAALATDVSLPTTALAVSISSVRFLPMSVALLPVLRGEKTKISTLLAAMHLVAITNWLKAVNHLPSLPQEERLPFYFGFCLTTISAGALGTIIGYHIMEILPRALSAAFLFLSPVFFTVAMVDAIKNKADWLAIILGFALALPFIMLLPNGIDLIAIGLVGGTIAYAYSRRQRAIDEAA